MKIGVFEQQGEHLVGEVNEEKGVVTPFALTQEEARQGVLALIGRDEPARLPAVSLDSLKLLAPAPRPVRNIFCVGKNYYDHAHEFSASGFDSSAAQGAVPKHPIVFSKVPESVIAGGEPILYDPEVSEAIDYETELAVIIGKGGRGVRPENAYDHVWGYTIINDVTARDLQGRYSQWLIGKSQDTFCPMGPWAVTRDDFDIENARISSEVNGETRQDSNTKLLIFDVPTIIATIAAGVTLVPGDIIATGTPAGVGIGFNPPKYLGHGDVVTVAVEGIGALTNEVRRRGA